MSDSRISLKKSFLNGSAWTLGSVGASQILRLGKSLILSRLLFPEAYGLMAIVWAVLYALDMLSDVGVANSIIRSARGGDAKFLNTAWTLKTVRGGILFCIACAVAYPLSLFYNQPQLALLIPVAGITTLIEGFASTNTYSNQRDMMYRHTTLLEFTTEIVGLIVTLLWAYIMPSVWALLGGAIIGRIYHVAASHIILPGIRNRIYWDSKAFTEIFTFGKWIFFSSVIFLLYAQGDRLILAKYLDTRMLGVYSIAIMLSEAVSNVIYKLNNSVLYPALSRIVNSEKTRLREVLYKARLGTDAITILPIAILMMIGSEVVSLLYDSRYQAAGWILQVLCIRLLMVAMLASSESCLFALGHSRYAVFQNLCRVAWLFIGVPLIWPLYGIEGVVWVVALTEVPVLIVLWSGLLKYKILSLRYEARSMAFVAVGCAIGYGLLQIPIGRT